MKQSDIILKAENISKSYAGHVAVESFSLTLCRGDICALLGQNGAGKSSILRMLAGIFYADSGKVEVRTDRKIGYLPEERGLYQNMKVQEHLEYLAKLRGLDAKEANSKAAKALEEIGLGEWRFRKVKQLSKGMQQKVQILATLLHDPELLILDEPFSGLDPLSLETVKNLISDLQAQGKAIIITTHEMGVAEDACGYISLINKGVVVWEGSSQQLKDYFGNFTYHVRIHGSDRGLTWSEHLHSWIKKSLCLQKGYGRELWEVEFYPEADLKIVLQDLFDHNHVLGFEQYTPNLEEAFKRLVKYRQEEESNVLG